MSAPHIILDNLDILDHPICHHCAKNCQIWWKFDV